MLREFIMEENNEKDENPIVEGFRTYKDKMRELTECFDRLEKLLEKKHQLEKEEQEEAEQEEKDATD